MQIVIALPTVDQMGTLATPVCGVPLLTRVVATAVRGGASRILLLLPHNWPISWLKQRLQSPAIEPVVIDAQEIGHLFDPENREHWRAVAGRLDDVFLWLPYDYLADKAPLAQLLASAANHPHSAVRFSTVSDDAIFARPTVLLKEPLVEAIPQSFEVVPVVGQPGVSARPPAAIEEVEAELVRRSGKVTDGIFSTFNRKLCRPAVRWLSHSSVTPNMVSFGGLAIALLSGLCFMEGSWSWNVLGAALFFVSGLFDEIDGMLARLKFLESPFGCWLETMADYSSYLLIFAGMTVGGYRHGGGVYLAAGGALLFGCVLSFAVISIQRKLAAPSDRPNEYSRLYLEALDRDASNPVSRIVRQLQFLTKKGVLIHYLLVFAILGALPLVLFLCTVGANVAWMVTIYFNRRLFSSNRRRTSHLKSTSATRVEVAK